MDAKSNMSDLIESYLKNVLHKNETVKSDAVRLQTNSNCVPSQINYVINTRFTIQQGSMSLKVNAVAVVISALWKL